MPMVCNLGPWIYVAYGTIEMESLGAKVIFNISRRLTEIIHSPSKVITTSTLLHYDCLVWSPGHLSLSGIFI